MSRGFKSSVVLTQDSPGHCSLAGTSLCTTKAVRAYFRDGVLPEEGTVCSVRERLFREDQEERAPTHSGYTTDEGEELGVLSREDEELLAAAKELHKTSDVKFSLH